MEWLFWLPVTAWLVALGAEEIAVRRGVAVRRITHNLLAKFLIFAFIWYVLVYGVTRLVIQWTSPY